MLALGNNMPDIRNRAFEAVKTLVNQGDVLIGGFLTCRRTSWTTTKNSTSTSGKNSTKINEQPEWKYIHLRTNVVEYGYHYTCKFKRHPCDSWYIKHIVFTYLEFLMENMDTKVVLEGVADKELLYTWVLGRCWVSPQALASKRGKEVEKGQTYSKIKQDKLMTHGGGKDGVLTQDN
ncbi:hypothetical protein BDZ97DRAFT_2002641 [Flammula alnicola]|nr:hypothetical protein BDZ97DRAFT_2002641 [Flammula alnicola]